jgi:hypothetical protein
MSDKVYVVTSGEYSDYSINCIFRTKGEAELWVATRWDSSRYEINEWEFEKANPKKMLAFSVTLYMKNGDVKWGSNEESHDGPAEVTVEWHKKEYSWEPPSHATLTVECLAKDRAHAIKIASEYRRMILASPLYGEWINSPDPSAIDLKWHHNEKSEEE